MGYSQPHMSTGGLARFAGASPPMQYALRTDPTPALLLRDVSPECICQGGELKAKQMGATGSLVTVAVKKDHSEASGRRGLSHGSPSGSPTSCGSIPGHIAA